MLSIDKRELIKFLQPEIEKIVALKLQGLNNPELDLITRRRACDEFETSLSTLDRLVNAGQLTPYKMKGKVYFKRSEIMKIITGE